MCCLWSVFSPVVFCYRG
uniref:Uncharacterized protein n=1 Tax=Anguilla anguilla TaxID=7936 RepID=A0A0E9T908_ANGAN